MSHRDRSVAYMRSEAKRIYNQRRLIKKLTKELKLNEYIVTELRFWLLEKDGMSASYIYEDVLDKMKELKEHYENVIEKNIK
jgi:hypothetical protein